MIRSDCRISANRTRKRAYPSPSSSVGISKCRWRVGLVGLDRSHVGRHARGARKRSDKLERLSGAFVDDADALDAVEETTRVLQRPAQARRSLPTALSMSVQGLSHRTSA